VQTACQSSDEKLFLGRNNQPRRGQRSENFEVRIISLALSIPAYVPSRSIIREKMDINITTGRHPFSKVHLHLLTSMFSSTSQLVAYRILLSRSALSESHDPILHY
jgi:hypothetical protein